MLKFLIPFLLLSFKAHSATVNLLPLCYSRENSCRIASEFLSLPNRGNFKVRSRCRNKNQEEVRKGLCFKYNTVLQIQAHLNLPNISQYTWRNKCFDSKNMCQLAAEYWRELSHPQYSFLAVCNKFNRKFWQMNDQLMDKRGIYRCRGAKYIELKVRAKRVR